METPDPVAAPIPAQQDDPFRNARIDASGLPQLNDVSFEPLDPMYARVRTIAAAITAGVILAIAIVTWVAISSPTPLLIGAVAVVVAALVAVAHRVETNHMGYLVRDHDVSFSSGVIGRSVATAPFARVQHVSIDRGPIDRRFGLAALNVRTAGGHLAIPGLRHDVAERLKELVTDRASVLADAEIDDDTGNDTDTDTEFDVIDGTGDTADDAA